MQLRKNVENQSDDTFRLNYNLCFVLLVNIFKCLNCQIHLIVRN